MAFFGDYRRRHGVISLLIIVICFNSSLSDYTCPENCQCNELILLTDCSYIGNISTSVSINISRMSNVLLLDGNSLDDIEVTIPWNNLSNLRKLSLKFNNILTFQEGTLSLLRRLLYLDVSNNLLQAIPDEIKQLNRLKYIDLSNNDIWYIEATDLHNLTKLQTLCITNSLKGISRGAFSHSYNLNSLFLSGSNFSDTNSCFEVFPWFGFSSQPFPLLELDISHANIVCLTKNTLRGITLLRSLNLNNNYIFSLPSNLIHNLTMLTKVKFVGNSLINIPPKFFTRSRKLQVLNLSMNNITSIESILITELQNIEYLYLEDNSVSEPSPLDFRIFTRLRELHLSKNQITEFPIVYNMPYLETLSLASNLIPEILPNALKNCKGLTHVDVSNNSLNTFAVQMDDSNIDSFKITDNKIRCDCKLLTFYESKLNADSHRVPSWIETMFLHETCRGSRRFRGMSLQDALETYYFDMQCSHETPPNVLKILIGSWLSLLLGVVSYVWIKTMCSARRKRKSWTSVEDQTLEKHRKKYRSIRDVQLFDPSFSESEIATIWEKEKLLDTREGENDDLDLKWSEVKWKSMTETFV